MGEIKELVDSCDGGDSKVGCKQRKKYQVGDEGWLGKRNTEQTERGKEYANICPFEYFYYWLKLLKVAPEKENNPLYYRT